MRVELIPVRGTVTTKRKVCMRFSVKIQLYKMVGSANFVYGSGG